MKRRVPTDSSLELLLDTICNTFGGVLFLAILVCILLRNTSHSSAGQQQIASKFSEADAIELGRRQKELDSALYGLRAAAARQDRIAALFVEPDAVGLREARDEAQHERDKLEAVRRTMLADIAAKHSKVAAIEKELSDLRQQVADAQKKVIAAESVLKTEIASHTVTATLPRERISTKKQIGFVVRYGRLYQWVLYDGFGRATGLNTDEFVVVGDRKDSLETRPKPHAGTPIETTELNQLGQRFRQFDPSSSSLTIAVWDDSFDLFQKVKAAAIKGGFEYRLILMREGESLVDRGGSDGRVQ